MRIVQECARKCQQGKRQLHDTHTRSGEVEASSSIGGTTDDDQVRYIGVVSAFPRGRSEVAIVGCLWLQKRHRDCIFVLQS